MAGPGAKPVLPVRATIRLDKWLWQARFFRSRVLATEAVAAGQFRLNGQRVTKPAQSVGAGDTLTFAQDARVRLIRVQSTGQRRGSFPEAQTLYLDLDVPPGHAVPKTE